ncbi:MAG TPA: LamG-like jellyroll fold domain-containing protein, partial [Pseudonocardiaceae bacterium]
MLGLGLGLGAEPASAEQLGWPSVSLPSLSQIASWFSSPSWGNLPRQQSGTADGRGHDVSAAATHAAGGTGHKPGKGTGELAPYTVTPRSVKSGASGGQIAGFNAATSERNALKSNATVSYFDNADGSVTRQITQSPANYRDSSGAWQPIDTTVQHGSDNRWHEQANSLRVDFAPSATDPALASFASDSTHAVAYGLQGAAAVTGTASGSTVTYPAVLPQTDLELAPLPTGMKESLVLHSSDAGSSWVFPLRLTGLTPVLASDGAVELKDSTGATVERIPRAFAYDSKVDPTSGEPATTYAVTYALTTVDGGPALKMTLDQAWLRDPARVFPVTVDPSFYDLPTSTYAETTAPGDHSMDLTFKVGSYNSGPDSANSFLKFPNDLDGSGVVINSAALNVFDTWASTCAYAEPFYVAPVTQAWTPSGVTSWPGPSYGAAIGSATPDPNVSGVNGAKDSCHNLTADRTVGDWVNIPLNTDTIQAWADGSPDNGLALYAATNNTLTWKQFDSSNIYPYAPFLAVTTTWNVAPQVDSLYPTNGGVATSTTPMLLALGHDIDNSPGALQFRFYVYDANNALVVDSGLVSSGTWTVPSGKLKYGQTYYWTAQTYDGTDYSDAPGWNSLSVQVPQPSITSSLSQNSGNHGFDPSVGNYTTNDTDASVQTAGPALEIQRDYNSRDPRVTGAFGAGWSSIADAKATEQYDASGAVSSVVVTYPDGSEVGYGKNTDGSFSPPSGRFATFKSITGGYSLTDKNDTTYTFTQGLGSGAYGITSITDANNRALNFTWSSGQLTTMTSATSGRALHLVWSTPSGSAGARVATVSTDPVTTGQPDTALTWTYSYSGDQLASVCPPGTTTDCSRYTYTSGSQFRNQVLDLGPQSFWPFGESSGTVASSAVLVNEGSDNATYSNVTLGQPGPLAGSPATAAGFDGSSSSVRLPLSDRFATAGPDTVSLWFKTAAGGPGGVLFSTGHSQIGVTPASPGAMPVLYVGADGKLYGQFWTGSVAPIVSGSAVNDGNWHHVVLTSAGPSQTMYVDGTSAGSRSGNIANVDPYTFVGAGYFNPNFTWGSQPAETPAGSGWSYFTGSIADVALYTQPFTASQVSALHTAGTRTANLLSSVVRQSGTTYAQVSYDPTTAAVSQVTDENGGVWKVAPPTVSGSSQVYRSAVLGSAPTVYYRFGDTAGAASAYDEVNGGSANYSNVTLGASGPFTDAPAASFNGSSSGVTPPDHLISASPTVSTELWFKTTSAAAGMLFSTGNSPLGTANPSDGAMPVLYVGNDGKLYGHYWNGNVGGMASPARVNDGAWHHVVLSGAGSTQTMYLDGVQIGTAAGAIGNVDPLNFVGAGVFNNRGWAAAPSGNVWNYFNGSISDVAIYHSALTADQVSQHYLAARNSQGLSPMTTVTVTDPGNKTLTNQYDPLHGNREIAEIDALGFKTSYGYDTSGFLYTTTDPDGNVTTTGHDVRGNTVSQTKCQNQAAGTCSTAYYTYYPDDTTAQLTTADPRNDLLLTVRDGRSASATDNTYLTTYGYDSAGDRTGVTTPPVPGFPSGRTTTVAYSDGTSYPAADGGNAPAGLPVRTTSPGGAVNQVSYLRSGDVASTINADGLVTNYAYDGLGRMTSKNIVSDAYPGGLVTSYTYDSQDKVVSETDPPVTNRVTGAVHTARTTSVYDPDGNLTSQTVADTTGGDASRTELSTYNSYGQLVTSTDADNNATSYTYDAYGNKISETDPAGTETDWSYDADGRQLTQSLHNFTGNPLNPQTAAVLTEQSRAYDPAGRLASLTDSMGTTTSYTYFDNGLTATVTKTDSSGNNPFVEESDSYDSAGNLVKKVTNNGANTETYAVDAADRTTKTVDDPTGLARASTVSYTPDDQVATSQETDATGWNRTVSATYDPMGNQTAQSISGDDSGHPIGWWQLNQASGTTVTDSSGNGNTANATGVTWADGAASFAGGSGQQIATNGPVLDTTASYSVSAWVNLSSKASGWQTAVAQTGNQASAFYLQYDATDDAWSFSQSASDTANPTTAQATATGVDTGTWTHLVGVYYAEYGISLLFVNGQELGASFDVTPFSANGPLVVGREKYNGGAMHFFNGAVSNVQVYQRALASWDVDALYNAGRSGGTTASTPAVTTSWTLDKRGLPTSMTDADGNVTGYSYDEAGQLAVTTAPVVNTEINGSAGVPTHPVTTVGYNAFGQPVESEDPDGNITTTAYDAVGQAVSATQPNYTPPGSSTPITATTVRTYDNVGNLTSVNDPLDHTTRYTYDQLGDLVRSTAPDGGNTDATYDTDGDKLSVTDPTGAQTQATYDYLGRPLTSTTLERYPSAITSTTTNSYAASTSNPGGAFLASATTQDGATTSYGYDGLGETTAVTDGAGNTTRYSYNFLGDKATTTLPDGTSTAISYDARENPTLTQQMDTDGTVLAQTSATYDGTGRMLSSTDARGSTSTFTYDATGVVTQEVQPVSATSSITTSFGYDAAGNRTRYTDGRGNPWIYTYNSWNQPESQIEPATDTYSSASDRTFTTAYDADGQAVTQTQPGGVTITAGYDVNGDLTSQTGSGADAATASRTFGYDSAGRMTSAATSAIGTSGGSGYVPASNETFGYNDRGELLNANGSAGSSSFGYNADGLMTSRSDAAGNSTYSYDTADRLSTTDDATTGVTSSYGYNSLNQVTSINYGSGGNVRNLAYDGLHRLTSDILKTSSGSTVASIAYGYDPNGNLTSKTTAGFSGAAANTYTYDEANRLTSWNDSTTTTDYAYDASGNRTQVGSNVYTYDARDQLTSDGTNSYTYTARGTLAHQTSGSDRVDSTSDAFGQMISQGTQTYAYDALGRTLTDSAKAGGTVTFAFSGTDNLVASDGANTYGYDPTGGLLGVGVAAAGGGTTTGSGVLAFTDSHTDLVGQFTANGTSLAGSTTYDPLGNVASTSGQIGQLGYQSGWTDPGTKKVNMAARWYSPATGQFMNRDTVSQDPVPNSAAANPFAYGDDDPLANMDPTGHWSLGGWVKSKVSAAAHYVANKVVKPIARVAAAVVKKVVAPVVHVVKTVVHRVADAYHKVVRTVVRAAQHVVRQVRKVVKAAVHTVRTAYHVVKKAAAAVEHKAVATAKSAAATVGRAAKTAVTATEGFIQHHAAAIVSTVAGIGAFAGCEALTGGVGSIGCAALAGAVANGVTYGMSCGSSKAGCSWGGAAEAVGLGAAAGALGGALAGPLGGKLVQTALEDVLPEAAASGLVGAGSGAITGGATGAVDYGLSCHGSTNGCSLAGLGKAAATGAVVGGVMGGLGGALGGRGCTAHSFTGQTAVLLADGSSRPISQVKVGDQVADAVPGDSHEQVHTVERVIVTTTDHDFVDVTVKADHSAGGVDTGVDTGSKTGLQTRARTWTGKLRAAVAAVALAAVTVTSTGSPAAAATPQASPVADPVTVSASAAGGSTLTTTFHHPFFDITQAAFTEADHLHTGDRLQTTDGGTATITNLRLYHQTTTTYDLTIGGLHTYYVLAGP